MNMQVLAETNTAKTLEAGITAAIRGKGRDRAVITTTETAAAVVAAIGRKAEITITVILKRDIKSQKLKFINPEIFRVLFF